MMTFSRDHFDKCVDRSGSWSIKWDPDYMIERFGTADLLPFNHAEMDFECPEPIIKAIQDRSRHGIYGYTLVKDEYYQSVIEWYAQRHKIRYNSDEILYSTGVIFSLRNIIQFFTKKKDQVLIFPPVYKPLADVATDQDRTLVFAPLILNQGKYYMDFEAIERIFQQNSIQMVILCNPHNPVGRVWTGAELQKLGDLCLTFNVVLVSDEIHCDLLSDGHPYTSISAIFQEEGLKSIVLSSFTKTFNTSGLKIANIFIKNPKIREPFFNFYDKKFIYAPNVFAIHAVQAAYNQCGPWVDILTRYLDDNFNFVQKYLSDNCMEVEVIRREGTPVIWLDFRNVPLPSERMFRHLIDHAHIIPYDGRDFTACGEGFQRLSIGYPRQILEEGLNRIRLAIRKIQ